MSMPMNGATRLADGPKLERDEDTVETIDGAQSLPSFVVEAAAEYQREQARKNPRLATNKDLDKITEQQDRRNADESLVAALAKLSPFEYDRKRKDAAKEIGIAVGTLDQAVKQHREQNDEDGAVGLPHWKVQPSQDQVDGEQLLNALAEAFIRHIILPPHGADMLALWTLHTWGV